MDYKAKDYLPQREPFLFADKFTVAENNVIVGTKHFDDNCIFIQNICLNKIVPKMIMLEMLIQCGGAGFCLINSTKELFFLTTIKKVRMKKEFVVPNSITMKIVTIKTHKKSFWQTGHICLDNKKFLQATWGCVFADTKQG